MNHVLDACAMIAYLRGEAGAEKVAQLLADPTEKCHVHTINLCEVFYDFVRASDAKTARVAVRDLTSLGIVVHRNLSARFWQRVGVLKGEIRRISLADCFAIALAEVHKADVVTSDHHEFDALAANGMCRVTCIR